MPTLYDLSRMMGGSGSRVGSITPSRDASVGGVSGGQSGSSSSVRYGYALADSADGWVDVQLDTSQTIGGDSTVQCVCDSPISQGQRVAVDVMPNGQLKARPIGQNILDEAISDAAEKIQEAGQEILDSVNEDMAAVDAELEGVRGDVSAAQSAAQAAQSAADAAAEKADEAASQITDVKTTVEQELGAIKVTVSGVSETADSALRQASEAKQDLEGFRTTVSQTYETKADADAAMAQEVLDRNSAISQSATEIKQEVSQNYVSNETGETLATKAEVTQSANQIKQEVSQNYQVKGDYATSGELDDAIAKEVSDRNSAITQSVNSIKQEVSQNYVNNETGATLATKAELQTTAQQITGRVDKVSETADSALRQSSEAIQKADEVSTSLTTNYVSKTDADAKYATKSLVQQTSDSILQQVSEDYQSAESASQMQSQIDQNAEAIRTEVSERKQAVTGAVKDAKSYTDQKADSISQTVEQKVMDEVGRTYATKTELTQTASGLELNITAAVDKADAAQGTANDAKGDAEDALDKANEVSSYFKADVTGLEIGQQGEPSSVKMNSAGAFQVLVDKKVVSQFAAARIDLGNSSSPMATFGPTETHLGMGSTDARIMLLDDTFQISADSSAFGGNNLIISPRDQSVDQTGDYVNVNSILILRDANTYMAMQGGSTVFESREDFKVRCPSGNVGIYGDGIWMGTTGSIVKPGGMMGGNSVSQSLPSSNVTFSANSYYDCFTGETATGGVSAVFYRSGSYMYIWLPRSTAGVDMLPTPVLVSGMAYAGNVSGTNFAASLEISKYSGGGDLMSHGTLSMGVTSAPSGSYFATLTCPSALVMLGRSTSGPTVYRMRMMGRSSNGGATLQSWYMTAHLM